MKSIRLGLVIILFTGFLGVAVAEDVNDMSVAFRKLRSEVQSMSHGYHSHAEWGRVLGELDIIEIRARAAENPSLEIEAGLLKARAYSDIFEEHLRALKGLEELRRRYDDQEQANLPKVYALEAEIYAQLGDEKAIRDLIKGFRESANYDEQPYAYEGGQGRDEPLQVLRPSASGGGSLTVTAMEKALEASRMAPGRPCPAFTAVDAAGKSVSLKDFRGRVVLLDFWSDDWETWRRDLPQLVETYKTYHPKGFEVVGFCISPNRDKALAYAAREGADWTMVPDGAPVAAKFGLYGEAGSFLVGPNGAILARNLHGAERVNKVRGALGFDN